MKTYGPTMQCNSKTMDYCQLFQMSTSGHHLCPHEPPINLLIDDRLSVSQTLPHSQHLAYDINMPTAVALLRFCNLQD